MKTDWIKCKEPTDAGQWVTPPNCQGQIVLVSYAQDGDVIYRRSWDQNTDRKTYGQRTYEKRFLNDDALFEPWQTEPA